MIGKLWMAGKFQLDDKIRKPIKSSAKNDGLLDIMPDCQTARQSQFGFYYRQDYIGGELTRARITYLNRIQSNIVSH